MADIALFRADAESADPIGRASRTDLFSAVPADRCATRARRRLQDRVEPRRAQYDRAGVRTSGSRARSAALLPLQRRGRHHFYFGGSPEQRRPRDSDTSDIHQFRGVRGKHDRKLAIPARSPDAGAARAVAAQSTAGRDRGFGGRRISRGFTHRGGQFVFVIFDAWRCDLFATVAKHAVGWMACLAAGSCLAGILGAADATFHGTRGYQLCREPHWVQRKRHLSAVDERLSVWERPWLLRDQHALLSAGRAPEFHRHGKRIRTDNARARSPRARTVDGLYRLVADTPSAAAV